MNLNFNLSLAEGYKSNSQIARVLTEGWVEENAYCPNCGNASIKKFKNNKPISDFFCPSCGRIFELKSKSTKIKNIINDGAYSKMIEQINNKSNPDFLFLAYSKERYIVNNFFVVPKHFFTPKIIIKRKPLSRNAQRAGWVGCNINIGAIPLYGRIFIIKNQLPLKPKDVINQFNKTKFLDDNTINNRGWIIDVMNCVDRISQTEFTLADVYKFEKELKLLYPNNHNIKAKIRQQLQLLRDANIIEFLGNGKYRKILNNK
ncbi:MAG: restriction endonuclease [Clostridiales bacterium]|mgnify:CR=1 FL=1|nr:restriction endonuclease [Clostridiales bacterium]